MYYLKIGGIIIVKKNYFKSFITIAMVLLITISMVACGKTTQNESEETTEE